jgi:hypothetical protein
MERMADCNELPYSYSLTSSLLLCYPFVTHALPPPPPPLGLPQHAPLSAIHVGAAAAPGVLHTLRRQLAVGGTLVIPVDAARADATAPEEEEEEEEDEDGGEGRLRRHTRARTRARGERRGWASAAGVPSEAAAAARLRWSLFGEAQQLVRVVRTGADDWEYAVEADVRFVPLTDRDRQTAGVDL